MANAPALMVLADSYYDGWEAEVDGQPTPVYRANYALRGVFLPAGEHTVVFNYRPKPFMYGAIISLVTLAGLGVWFGLRRRQSGTVETRDIASGVQIIVHGIISAMGICWT
jgi:uncharacterized membrane protein YfhO